MVNKTQKTNQKTENKDKNVELQPSSNSNSTKNVESTKQQLPVSSPPVDSPHVDSPPVDSPHVDSPPVDSPPVVESNKKKKTGIKTKQEDTKPVTDHKQEELNSVSTELNGGNSTKVKNKKTMNKLNDNKSTLGKKGKNKLEDTSLNNNKSRKKNKKSTTDDDLANESESSDRKIRSFKVKLPNKEEFEGRFTGLTPYQAANKALSKYYRETQEPLVEISFSICESTRKSKKTVYTYVGKRQKLDVPVSYKIQDGREITKNFKNSLKKVKKGELVNLNN
jgi:hypothetical protein